jgi:hypothetical protein
LPLLIERDGIDGVMVDFRAIDDSRRGMGFEQTRSVLG